MPNAFLCAKCLSIAAHTVELLVQRRLMEQELCDDHMRELLDGARRAEAR
jgi:hypothetical protein